MFEAKGIPINLYLVQQLQMPAQFKVTQTDSELDRKYVLR